MTEEQVKLLLSKMSKEDKVKLAFEAGLKGLSIENDFVPAIAKICSIAEKIGQPCLENLSFLNSLSKEENNE